jgi:hypothetical protein
MAPPRRLDVVVLENVNLAVARGSLIRCMTLSVTFRRLPAHLAAQSADTQARDKVGHWHEHLAWE